MMAQIAPGKFSLDGDGNCEGDGLMYGLRLGASVTVTDASGVVIGASNFETASVVEDACNLYAPTDVSLGSDFYTVKFGDGPQVPTTRSAAEAREKRGIGVGYGY